MACLSKVGAEGVLNRLMKFRVEARWLNFLAGIYFFFRFLPVFEVLLKTTLLPFEVQLALSGFLVPALVFLLKPRPSWLQFPSRTGWIIGGMGGLLALGFYSAVHAQDPHLRVQVSGFRIFNLLTQIPSKWVLAVGEELFFRCWLQESLRHRGWRPWQSIAFSALFFFLGHAYHPPLYWAATLPFGLLLGWVADRTRSIWPSVLAHAIGNASVSFITRLV